MRKFIIILTCLIFFQINNFAQQDTSSLSKEYSTWMEKGKTALGNKNYETCAACYKKAAQLHPSSYQSKYLTARCFALLGKTKKSHKYLTQAIRQDWEDVETWLERDAADFEKLKKKKRCWKKIEKEIVAQQKGLNMELRNELLAIEAEDQKYRSQMAALIKKGDPKIVDSPAFKKLEVQQAAIDKKLLPQVENIIEKYGYPTQAMVGKQPRKTVFLVIQHADLEQQEKYLPLFQKAVKDGTLKFKTLALMIDRIEMAKGRPQIYGTQVKRNSETGEFYFYNILNERNLEKRRAAVGLPPIEDYAKRFGFEYKFIDQKLPKKEFNKILKSWDLVNIKDATTNEIIFTPKQNFWIELTKKSKFKFNWTKNICQGGFKGSPRRGLTLSPAVSCTEMCCDDAEIRKILDYQKVSNFELHDGVLFLVDTRNQIFEFKLKEFKIVPFEKKN